MSAMPEGTQRLVVRKSPKHDGKFRFHPGVVRLLVSQVAATDTTVVDESTNENGGGSHGAFRELSH